MRLFIAIDLDEPVKQAALDVQRQAKTLAAKGRFSRKEHFHLTLRFIGETPEEHLPLIKQAAEQAAKDVPPFLITIDHLGHFQNRSLHVLWTGLEENPLLQRLQKNVDDQLEKAIGLPAEERPYTPHITLGRNIRFEDEWETVLQQVSVQKMQMAVSHVTLFESRQVDGRLRYLPLECFPLGQ